MIRRRFLLGCSALTAAGLALAGCNGQTVNQTVATLATDAQTIAAGLQGTLTELTGLGIAALTPSIVSAATTAVAGLQTVAASLQAVTTTVAAQPLVQQIEGYVNAFVSAVAGMPATSIPADILAALKAASILLPVLESLAGLVLTPAPAAERVRATGPAMSADQARLILKGMAQKR